MNKTLPFFLLLLVAPIGWADVITVSRKNIDEDGSVTIRKNGTKKVVRLPASNSFEKGSLLSVDGEKIKVDYVSRNVASPSFEFGRRGRFMETHPLYAQEQQLLDYSGLYLYPDAAAPDALKAADAWIDDLKTFLKLHERDPKVVSMVQGFVLNYSKNPPQGYLAGDHVWDNPRKIETWIQFYEYPMYYDLSGKPLTVNGRPLISGPSSIQKEGLSEQQRLYHKVMRNLRYTYEGFRTLLEEGDMGNRSAELAEVTCTRRAYLTLQLLEEGKHLWNRMQKR